MKFDLEFHAGIFVVLLLIFYTHKKDANSFGVLCLFGNLLPNYDIDQFVWYDDYFFDFFACYCICYFC